jgi:hypothetical protein
MGSSAHASKPTSHISSRVYWHSRLDFIPSRFPHAKRAVMPEGMRTREHSVELAR